MVPRAIAAFSCCPRARGTLSACSSRSSSTIGNSTRLSRFFRRAPIILSASEVAVKIFEREDVYEYTNSVLNLISKAEIDRNDAAWITRETLEGFRDHVNPGFLEYRKAASLEDTAAAVEWCDSGPNTYRDVNGKEYIDCLGGFGIFNVGHRHPKVVAAVTAQLARAPLHSQDLLDPLRAMLAKALAMLLPAPLEFAFFTSSGTESVEAALKLARLYDPAKPTVISALKGFHGKSFGSLSASAKGEFRKPFGAMLPNIEHVPFDDLVALEERMDALDRVGEDVAAVLLEPIQGKAASTSRPTITCGASANSAIVSARC